MDIDALKAKGDAALAQISNALDDLQYSPDQRPVPILHLAMDYVHDMLALLSSRQGVAPVAWMPIDSAPRDGSWIVLVNAQNGESATAKSAGPEFSSVPDYKWIHWPYINGQPTHWMHCPKESN